MADTKISATPAMTSLDGTEKIPGVQSGANRHLTPDLLATFFAGEFVTDPAGVVGDGSTDDTMAIETLLSAGGVVHLSRGRTYLVADVAVPAGSRIIGYGATLKLKTLGAGVTSPILRITGDGVRIEGLILDGNKAAQPADGFADAYLSGSTGRSVRCAILSDGNDDLDVSGCLFKATYGGAVVTRDCTGVRVNNNRFLNCNFEALWCSKNSTGCTDYQFNNNYLRNIGSGHASVNSNGVLLEQITRATISGNQAYNLERNFVKVEKASRGVTITGNVVEHITKDNFAAIQLQMNASGVISHVTITSNEFYDVQAGVQINGSSGGTFKDITVRGNVIDGLLGTTQGDGVECLGGGSGLIVDGNTIRGVKRYAVRVRSSVAAWSGVQIRGNVLEGSNSASSSNIAILIWPDTGGEITDFHVADNEVLSGFVAAAGVGWITLWTPTGASALRRGRIAGNVVKGSSGVRAFEQVITTTTVDNVVVEDNLFDGTVTVQNTSVIWGDRNRVTGSLAVPLYGTLSWDAGAVNHNAPLTNTITASGAAVGDRVDVTCSVVLSGLRLIGEVTAANTVTITLFQPDDDAADVNLGSATYRAWVRKGLT